MSAQVIVLGPRWPSERLFEVELHGLMRREELIRACRGALRRDLRGGLLEALEVRRGLQGGDVDGSQGGGVVACVGSQEVQRGGGVPVSLQQTLRIPLPVGRGEAVDVVALERHDLAMTLNNLRRLAPRLAVLPSDTRNADRGLPCDMLRNHAHLQQELQLGLKAVLLAIHEPLGAVTALDDETLSPASSGQETLEAFGLGGAHQRRELAELREDLAGHGLVLPLSHLLGLQATPGRGGPGKGLRHRVDRQAGQ
mmetsp:Transcript_67031/g.151446  ORF Transcript_67031/g.151446 Transcript_67031/m.151446 type:complete len:254 (+) Transcript_67031:794-1555(+)